MNKNTTPSSFIDIVSKILKTSKQPVRIAEIGVGRGSVTREVAKLLRPGDIYDLFDREDCFLFKDMQGLTNASECEIIIHRNTSKIFDSYAWTLGKFSLETSAKGNSGGLWDAVYLHGAHTFPVDGPAACVLKEMVKSGGYLVFGDVKWSLASSPTMNTPAMRALYTDEQMASKQVGMIVDLFMRTDPRFAALTERNEKQAIFIRNRASPALNNNVNNVMDDTLRRRPRVGLVGFFGHGNYGDELFVSVFKQHFGSLFDLEIVVDLIDRPYYSRPVEQIVSECDAIIIGGGDLVRPWEFGQRWFNHAYLAKPVYILGIGVAVRDTLVEESEVTDKYKSFFRHPNVKFIGVRDDQSRTWIESRCTPNVAVRMEPDIVCSLSLPVVKKNKSKILGIVTRQRVNIEKPDNYSHIEKFAKEYIRSGWKVRQIILGTGRVGMRDMQNADDFHCDGKEIVRTENIDDLSRAIGQCSVLATMKFHGTVVATMYGVPSIVLNGTSKQKSFMDRIARSYWVGDFRSDTLLKYVKKTPPAIDPRVVNVLRHRATSVMKDVAESIISSLVVR